MNIQEIREKNTAELEKTLKDLKEELFNLRFQLAINQLDNPTRITAVKRDIARVNTVLRENELKNSTEA
ncbi:MAG: 50S ribosomal protein L29 [Clostridia bacterium]|nr:50S ribosomal protein L29 [Clostridia bacterium]